MLGVCRDSGRGCSSFETLFVLLCDVAAFQFDDTTLLEDAMK